MGRYDNRLSGILLLWCILVIISVKSFSPNDAFGIYSFYLENSRYIGPLFKLRHGERDETTTFFADAEGNLGTACMAQGMTFSSWYGGDHRNVSVYVVTWFDQSISENHASQPLPEHQPIFNIVGRCVTFQNTSYLSLLRQPQSAPSLESYSFTVYHGDIRNNGWIFGIGNDVAARNGLLLRRYYHWYEVNWQHLPLRFGLYAPHNVITEIYNGSSRLLFVNSILVGTFLVDAQYKNGGVFAPPFYIGRSTNGNYLDGTISYLHLTTHAMTENDRVKLEAKLLLQSSTAVSPPIFDEIVEIQFPQLSPKGQFAQLGLSYDTDKITHHAYYRYYPQYLEAYRTVVGGGMLEIGTENFHSIEMWLRYFEYLFIYGIDISVSDEGTRFKIMKADQSDIRSVQHAMTLVNHPIIFIIDDGSHIPEHQQSCFNYLFERILIPGGLYIIEDIETSYWTQNHLYGYPTRYGLGHRNSTIEVFKKLIDDVNSEFLTPSNKLRQVDEIAGVISDTARRMISSISFGYNCVIIRKKTREEAAFDDRTYRLRQNL